MSGALGTSVVRADAVAKVTGAAAYAADHVESGVLHATLTTSTISVGSITSIDVRAAEQVPGVRLVLTHTRTWVPVSATGSSWFRSSAGSSSRASTHWALTRSGTPDRSSPSRSRTPYRPPKRPPTWSRWATNPGRRR
ncbi:hypothetical protein [Lentzea pudingi]|uniref:hypothetical protein n=1 Tax=Lentzea pudingi TaxID=1789439 RepID=UPI00166D9612